MQQGEGRPLGPQPYSSNLIPPCPWRGGEAGGSSLLLKSLVAGESFLSLISGGSSYSYYDK